MKQLLIILLVLISFSSKAQPLVIYDSVGNAYYPTEDTIKLPFSVAKTIAKELVGCDSVKAIHELTKEQLALTENKVVLKDSIISNYVKKENIYKQVITNQEQKFELQGQWVNELRKQNKTLKVKLTFTRIISILFTGFITYIYIKK
jgi:CRISPR/Cas system CMR subunit Cmr4 (Cas7 group RAMP superfamily)